MAIDKKLIDQLLTDYKKPEDIIRENGLLKELTKAILERALEAEMTDHLGYEKHDPAGHHRGNTRNGKSPKTLKGDFGELDLETPRDRKAGSRRKVVFKERSSSSRRCGNCEPKVQGSVGKPFFGFSTEPSVSTTHFAGAIRLRC